MAVEWTDLGGSHTLAFAAGAYRLSVPSLEGADQEAPRWLVSRTACQLFRGPWGHPLSLSWSCAAPGPGLGSLQAHSWPGGPSYSRLSRRLPSPTGPWTLVAAGAQTARARTEQRSPLLPSSLGSRLYSRFPAPAGWTQRASAGLCRLEVDSVAPSQAERSGPERCSPAPPARSCCCCCCWSLAPHSSVPSSVPRSVSPASHTHERFGLRSPGGLGEGLEAIRDRARFSVFAEAPDRPSPASTPGSVGRRAGYQLRQRLVLRFPCQVLTHHSRRRLPDFPRAPRFPVTFPPAHGLPFTPPPSVPMH